MNEQQPPPREPAELKLRLSRRDSIAIGVLVGMVLLIGVVGNWLGQQRQPTAPAPTPAEATAGAIYGMVIRDPWYDFGTDPAHPEEPNRAAQDRMGEILGELGVRWVRLEFHLEGGDLTLEQQLARYDYFIREVAPRHNLRILGLLGYGLIRGQDPMLLAATSSEVDPLYGPGIDNAKRIWLNRALLVVNRYGGAVAAYQVLNEPNRLTPTWTQAIPAAEVARLQTALYRAVRQGDTADPDDPDAAPEADQAWRAEVQLILSGIQPAGSGEITAFGHLPDSYYLRQLYASESFQRYHSQHGRYPLDGLGYHPYPREIDISLTPTPTPTPTDTDEEPEPSQPEQPDPARDIALMQERLDVLRGVLTDLGAGDLPFWLTEIGYNAGFGLQDDETQATFLHLLSETIATRPDVAQVFWFKYEDFPPASGPDAQRWGVVRIPFVGGPCPGGACYEPAGRPDLRRPAFFVYREQTSAAARLPEPPARVLLRGNPATVVDRPLTLCARVERPSAALPLTYTWEIVGRDVYIEQADLKMTLDVRWSEPGIYQVRLEASNAGGSIINSREVRVYPHLRLPGLRRV